MIHKVDLYQETWGRTWKYRGDVYYEWTVTVVETPNGKMLRDVAYYLANEYGMISISTENMSFPWQVYAILEYGKALISIKTAKEEYVPILNKIIERGEHWKYKVE